MHEIRKLLNLRTFFLFLKAYRIDPFRTVNEAVRDYFQDPRLVQIFNRYATYNGSNPFKAPATLNIIPYVENVLGGYYIKGGMYRLIQEMEKMAKTLGVDVSTESKVEKIEYVNKQIRGLKINNDFVPFDYVICNADVVEAFSDLIEHQEYTSNKLQTLEPSLSGLVFLWSIRGAYQTLAHHNIFFSGDYQTEFAQIFEKLQAPDDPTVYISITQKSDHIHAPAGCENWFVLINMPYLTGKEDWPVLIKGLRQSVLEKLKKQGVEIEKNIIAEEVLTPQDFYRLYQSNRGSIYGLSSNSRTTAFTRPANRNRNLKGLYFAGGSVHPGGGVPLVILSGKMAADLIAEQEGMKIDHRLNYFLEKHQADNRNFL
jgi:phytoene desaturase